MVVGFMASPSYGYRRIRRSNIAWTWHMPIGGSSRLFPTQLCLLGYGGGRQWDQVAIGSWGESICYDPDVNLGRSMIDDVRPLMVNGSSGVEWSWTNNIGGGDFLVYDDADGHRQKLVDMKTAFLRYGPVMTEVVYAGVSADRAIAARITASTVRSNDFPHHFHTVRYDVAKPVRFKRMAFYQAGADRYNENHFSRMAHGDVAGMKEEWDIKRTSRVYDRMGIAAPGPGPWFSFHGVDPVTDKPVGGGGASRGLIVHFWKARLGGKDRPVPFFSIFERTERNSRTGPAAGRNRIVAGRLR